MKGTAIRTGRPASLGLVLLMVAASVILPAPPAHAFDTNKAAQYAERWVVDSQFDPTLDGKVRNPDYKSYSNDCTNYASQVWFAAGVAMRFNASQAAYDWWYYNGDSLYFLTHSGQSSLSWRENSAFVTSQVGGWGADFTAMNMTQQYTPALPGELYEYDHGTGDGWSHLAVAIGWTSSYDYPQIGPRGTFTGDYMNQHTRDRQHAPWNWGYLNQWDTFIKANMRARIVGI